MKEEQQRVREFIEENGLESRPPFRIMDLVSEIGEIVKDATKTAEYGMDVENMSVKEDEIGDALFSLLAVANSLGIDASSAFESAMEKYEGRVAERDSPGSGSHS